LKVGRVARNRIAALRRRPALLFDLRIAVTNSGLTAAAPALK
jgi:hypothetical protein